MGIPSWTAVDTVLHHQQSSLLRGSEQRHWIARDVTYGQMMIPPCAGRRPLRRARVTRYAAA